MFPVSDITASEKKNEPPNFKLAMCIVSGASVVELPLFMRGV